VPQSRFPIYRQEVIDRAREHGNAGWSRTDIARLLGEEFGHAPCTITIAGWLDEEYAERRRRETRAAKRRQLARKSKPRRDISPELRLEKMRKLRTAGATLKAIAIVSDVLWGEPLTADQVRYRLRVSKATCEERAS
jgi:hypothetical protein